MSSIPTAGNRRFCSLTRCCCYTRLAKMLPAEYSQMKITHYIMLIALVHRGRMPLQFLINIIHKPACKSRRENHKTQNIKTKFMGDNFQQPFWNDQETAEGNHVVHLSVSPQVVDSRRNTLHCMSAALAASSYTEYVWIQMQTLSMSAQVQKTFDWRQDPHHQKYDTMDDVEKMSASAGAFWWGNISSRRKRGKKRLSFYVTATLRPQSEAGGERGSPILWVCQSAKEYWQQSKSLSLKNIFYSTHYLHVKWPYRTGK